MPWLRCQTSRLAQSMSSSFLITLYHGAQDVPRQENSNVVEFLDKIVPRISTHDQGTLRLRQLSVGRARTDPSAC
ncbi:hypothetical protein K435DRAFT_113589 [Dendrothele bispora CBS 962.96]|uniref:Uncharacterized protein n=1 Tax=Dendrothele bispora (strain CBS 962.96) TaxID=1314807 RepID=A0A4S8M1T7_DENBC|nr:hypothetical protein K435DRAFT_113589 [Dendrothele bispora CBS 962.96]